MIMMGIAIINPPAILTGMELNAFSVENLNIYIPYANTGLDDQ